MTTFGQGTIALDNYDSYGPYITARLAFLPMVQVEQTEFRVIEFRTGHGPWDCISCWAMRPA